MARKRKKLTPRQRAARKGARTRKARRAFVQEANRYLERVVRRQERQAVREAARERRLEEESILQQVSEERELEEKLIWEATTRYKKGDKDAVSVNVRIRKRIGIGTRGEAAVAIAQLQATERLPAQWEFIAVDWHKGGKTYTKYNYTGVANLIRGAGPLRLDQPDESL